MFYLSEEDQKWIAENIRDLKNVVSNRSRPPQEHSWSEAEDHQAPDTYIVKSPSGGIPARGGSSTTGTGTGTGTGGDDAEPGKADDCQFYRIDHSADPPLLEEISGFLRTVYNVSDSAIEPNTYAPVTKTKNGRWVVLVGSAGSSLVGVMLAEDHPGRGNLFNVYLGVRSGNEWAYDCNELYQCIDHRFGVPYPEIYATGLAMWIDGTTLEMVALDCVSPDRPCSTTGTGS